MHPPSAPLILAFMMELCLLLKLVEAQFLNEVLQVLRLSNYLNQVSVHLSEYDQFQGWALTH